MFVKELIKTIIAQNQKENEKDYKTPENLFRYSPLMKKNNPYFKKQDCFSFSLKEGKKSNKKQRKEPQKSLKEWKYFQKNTLR